MEGLGKGSLCVSASLFSLQLTSVSLVHMASESFNCGKDPTVVQKLLKSLRPNSKVLGNEL